MTSDAEPELFGRSSFEGPAPAPAEMNKKKWKKILNATYSFTSFQPLIKFKLKTNDFF